MPESQPLDNADHEKERPHETKLHPGLARLWAGYPEDISIAGFDDLPGPRISTRD
jgi:hypothetical protein